MQVSKILFLCAVIGFGSASNAQQPEQAPMGESMEMEHGMGGMDPVKMLERLKSKQNYILMMHNLSNKILAETDSQKQQALKDEQLELMKTHQMQMMSMHHAKPMQDGKPMDHMNKQ